ncbi:MAG TPA: DUF5715 family protein [Gemmatimonadaceae bacterium]
MPPSFLARLVTGAACLSLLAAGTAHAQSLRGSRSSIERMYRHARSERLPFLSTSARVRRSVASGQLVRLRADSTLRLHDVDFPYVRQATRTFVQRLAGQYHAACGERLVVTSAVRPRSRQPSNSTAHSVHPTGIAVDLRKPDDAGCRDWLRQVLVDLEQAGVIEATEEFHPPHFHVAVFPSPYKAYVAERKRDAGATATAAGAATYTVREGDTLWEIARRHDRSVEAIAEANDLDDDTIVPGQALRIP